MAINLQVENAVSSTAQSVKDQSGNTSPLALSIDKAGIGTTNPATTLEVVGDWTEEDGALRLTGDKPTVRFSGGTLSGNQSWILHVGSNGPGNLEFHRRTGPSQWSHVMGLAPNGNVGIGTTNPATTLEVVGDWTEEDGALRLTGDKPTVRFSGGALSGNQSWILHVGSNGPGNLEFYRRTGPAQWSHVMCLAPNGNVGIGTTDPKEKLEVNGNIVTNGDIRLTNADCAEDFDICETEQIEPGTVMVLGKEGKLDQSQKAYDKRVAGVVSGAGDYKPGIVLDKQQSSNTRKSIALLGKVYCKVDAGRGAIEIGDLLTTSPTPGHAMKADDPLKAFGAVIGKALRPLSEGRGLIPVLVALQ